MGILINLRTGTEVNIKTLRVEAEVRYWEDADLNGQEDFDGNIPCRYDHFWCPDIDTETGKINNWVIGNTAKLHYKVCDGCHWELLDEKDEIVVQNGNDYVPDTLCPERNGYGDYIIMSIDKDGYIRDWKFNIKDFINN